MTLLNCKNFHIYKLGKDSLTDVIRYNGYVDCKVKTKHYVADIKACVKNNSYPAGTIEYPIRQPISDHHLEIPTRSERNAYVIWLGEDFVNYVGFGHEMPPVSTFPPFAEYITEVKMYCKKNNGTVSVNDGKGWTVSLDSDEYPKWASFVVETSLLKENSTIQSLMEKSLTSKPPYLLPLYFNIYVNGIPNWIYANHHYNKTHDGPHPGNPNNYLLY